MLVYDVAVTMGTWPRSCVQKSLEALRQIYHQAFPKALL